MRRIFPVGTLQERIELYAVLGGMPGLWKLLDLSVSVEENLTNLFFRVKQLSSGTDDQMAGGGIA